MPNVLAHFGAQGLATHAFHRRVDPRWVMLGCILPDIPWILYRLAGELPLDINLYDMRLYFIAQASLVSCLLLAVVVASVSLRPKAVFLVLGVGSLLHLMLDAMQTKWGNGVHLFAPFSWQLLNFRLFWPESVVTTVMTVAGLVYAGWVWRTRAWKSPALASVSRRRLVFAVGAASLYLLLPLAFLDAVESENNHFVRTLREVEARAGDYVEFDRRPYLRRERIDVLRTYANEEVALRGMTLGESGQLSVRGRFVDPSTVLVIEAHVHNPWLRDAASYVGLAVLGILWILTVLQQVGRKHAQVPKEQGR